MQASIQASLTSNLRPPAQTKADPFGLMGPPANTNAAQARLMIPKAPGWIRIVANIVPTPIDARGTTPSQVAAMKAAGFRITFTARWLPKGGTPATFPTDLALYEARLNLLLDTYPQIEHLVIEDEENAYNQFGDPLKTPAQNAADFGKMLAVAVKVGRPRGVTVTDGGMISEMSTWLTYQDLVDRGHQADADAFWAVSGDSFSNKSSAKVKSDVGKLFLDQIKAAGPDQINFHKYVPDATKTPGATGGFALIAAFFAAYTGLPVVCNEWGVRDTSTTSVLNAAAGLDAAGLSLAVCYANGSGPGGAVSLWNGTSLAPNGQALADYISQHY